MTRIRKSIPGFRQLLVYVPTTMFNRLKTTAKDLYCPLNEFILDSLENAMNDNDMVSSVDEDDVITEENE